MSEKNWQYTQTQGYWSVRGSYEEPGNIEFLYKGEVFGTLTCPGYKIWNFAAHLHDYVPHLEELRIAEVS